MKHPASSARTAALVATATAALLTSTTDSQANGFYIPVQDAFATARGNAFVATADRPSAIYYNPAGLTQLESWAVNGGVYAVNLGIEAQTDIDGMTHENDNEFIPVPQLYVAGPINDRLAVGVAQRRAERQFFLALIVMTFITLRTVALCDDCWLVHTTTTAGMILGALLVPARSESQQDSAAVA